MLEQNFVTSMIKAGGNPLAFFERPIAAVLGILTILIWLSPVILGMVRRRGRAGAV
jgi:TctA family transporter